MTASLIAQTIERIKPADEAAQRSAQARLDQLTKPKDSLGALEQLIIRLAGITGKAVNVFNDKRVVIFAADHGVVQEGISAYPQEVTAQMVHNFLAGGAAVNSFAESAKAGVVCVDVGVAAELGQLDGLVDKKIAPGTANMCLEPAMSREQAEAAVSAGISVALEQAGQGAELFAAGEMGIGNTTASSAILAAFTGQPPESLIGRGTGIDDETLLNKIDAVRRALALHRPDPADALDVLHKVGGLELCALAGFMLGSAAMRIPVVIDGLISTTAALAAVRLCPQAVDYVVASHLSEEPGHRIALEVLGLAPGLHLRMRLGEGTGAVLMFPMIDAACTIMSRMSTFESAGVSEQTAKER